MAETAITEVVVPVAKWTLKRIWQELGYVFCYKSNIGDLNKQVQELLDKRVGVDLEVKPAREALKTIDPAVDPWLGDVGKLITEKETSFSEATVAAKAACCHGWLPNLKGRFSLGRKAKKMTDDVKELLASEPRTIAHPAPHAKVEFQPTEDATQLGTNFHEGSSSSGTSNHEQPPASEWKNINFDSRRSTIGDVMEALRGNQINPIIICGMGGIGKTTLMGQVVEKAKEEGLFDEYTKTTVKESLDKAAGVIQIQDELAEYLGTELFKDVKGSGPRASKLRERLSQGSKKILVMLDNVWTTTPDFLWEIGIPPSCQLLVTSRQQDLFNNMDTRKNFPIHGLSDRDAWNLFKRTAGSCIQSDPELHVVAKKVLEQCGGLPIAISTVGTALKDATIAIWKNALLELEKASPENVPGVIEDVYGKIKLSYECLPNEEAKSCLLLCCIFKENDYILIEDLVRYGFGLGFFKGIGSIVEARNRAETLVHTLKSRFLLLETDKKQCMKMHDVVRDVAVYIASGFEKRIVMRDTAATVKLMDLPEISDSDISVYCSSLGISGLCQLLLIRNLKWGTLELPSTIFNRMGDLKVVAFGGRVARLPPSLAVLRKLQTLELPNCSNYSTENVAVIGELRTLRILSLRGSDIEELPETFKSLSALKLLDLTDCSKLEVISAGVIKSLTALEELYMWNSFKNWVAEKLASTETTNWISQLQPGKREEWKRWNRLAVENPTKVGEWFWKDMHSAQLNLFDSESEDDDRDNREECTRWANSMDWETGILAELLSLTRLTTLQVFLPPLNVLLTTPFFYKLERFQIAIGWQHLAYCSRKDDGNYLLVDDLDASATVGSGITSLLEKTSFFRFQMKNLTETQLVNVFDTVWFAKIKSLEFEHCDSVEYLVDSTLVKRISPHSSSAIFPVLNSLKIGNAGRLKELFHGGLPTEWGVLRNILGHVQVLEIRFCQSLKGIVGFESDDEEVINFQSLTELTLDYLPNFTGIAKSISKKTEMLPEDTSPRQSHIIIQPLFDTKVRFPVLSELYIGHMNLKEIWNNQPSAESFCELKSLKVEDCAKLLHLVRTQMQNRLQKLERITASWCDSLETIFECRRLIVDDEGDATPFKISESGNQGTQINKMMSFKQSHQALQNLTEIFIMGCDSMRTLMYPSIARGLAKLQTLDISNCDRIEEIVAAPAEGEETEDDDNMFPQLRRLRLVRLPKLGSFSRGKFNFKWPLVKLIEISYCYNMKKFCSGSLCTSKEVKIFVEGAGESVLQQLNNSRQEI